MSPALDACPGVLVLHPARDGLVARIRLPGGYASGPRWLALAGLSRDFGDGCVDVTARGNVQLRGLRAADAEALATRAAAAGLMPSAEHDRARNITASPLSGLHGHPPLRALVDALDAALLAGPEFAALPGRFLFALDDGTGGASLAACDLGLRHAPAPSGADGSGGTAQEGFDLIVAGRCAGVRLSAAEAVPAVLAAARAALAAGVGVGVTRIAALPDGGQSVAVAAGGTLGGPASPDIRLPLGPALAAPSAAPSATSEPPVAPEPSPASHTGPSRTPRPAPAPAPAATSAAARVSLHDRDRFTVGFCGNSVTIMKEAHSSGLASASGGADVLGGADVVRGGADVVVAAAPLGRLSGEQIRVIANLVAPGEVVRVGVAGRLVVPVAAGLTADEATRRLGAGGLIVAADDPMGDVTACSGAACHRSLADVRAAAGPVSNYQRTHWAGCSRLCGRPPDAEPVVALDATRYRMPGEGGA